MGLGPAAALLLLLGVEDLQDGVGDELAVLDVAPFVLEGRPLVVAGEDPDEHEAHLGSSVQRELGEAVGPVRFLLVTLKLAVPPTTLLAIRGALAGVRSHLEGCRVVELGHLSEDQRTLCFVDTERGFTTELEAQGVFLGDSTAVVVLPLEAFQLTGHLVPGSRMAAFSCFGVLDLCLGPETLGDDTPHHVDGAGGGGGVVDQCVELRPVGHDEFSILPEGQTTVEGHVLDHEVDLSLGRGAGGDADRLCCAHETSLWGAFWVVMSRGLNPVTPDAPKGGE